MPLPLLANIYLQGLPSWTPPLAPVLRVAGSVGALAATKYLFGGTANRAERLMHGRVVMITGGTSGIGAVVAYELARRGASIVLLTAQPPSDPFVADYVGELRARAGHELIYAEQVDLASLHSIRTFATRWIDTLPPRRLDMVILCAAAASVPLPAGGPDGGLRGATTPDGIEGAWMVNYLANFHLLGLLSPALRAQPFDRDVRVIVATCSSYIGAPPLTPAGGGGHTGTNNTNTPTAVWSSQRAYARSKLALMVFARAFQKHVDAYKRPDNLPGNVRVLLVDPGFARTPGLRRWVAGGSLLWLLCAYVLLYPLWWLFVQSAEMGAQSVLFAAMEADLRRLRDLGSGNGSTDSRRVGEPLAAGFHDDPLAGKIIKACRLVDVARRDVADDAVAKTLWEDSDRLVEATEKQAAAQRQADQKADKARAAAEQKAAAQKAAADQVAAQKAEMAALVGAIKQGQQTAAKKQDKKDDKKSRRRA